MILTVPFFLLMGFGFDKGTQKEKGKRALLGNLVTGVHCSFSFNISVCLLDPE